MSIEEATVIKTSSNAKWARDQRWKDVKQKLWDLGAIIFLLSEGDSRIPYD